MATHRDKRDVNYERGAAAMADAVLEVAEKYSLSTAEIACALATILQRQTQHLVNDERG